MLICLTLLRGQDHLIALYPLKLKIDPPLHNEFLNTEMVKKKKRRRKRYEKEEIISGKVEGIFIVFGFLVVKISVFTFFLVVKLF